MSKKGRRRHRSNLKFQIASPEVKLGREDHPYGWQSCSPVAKKAFKSDGFDV
jgi:hypothetical protein